VTAVDGFAIFRVLAITGLDRVIPHVATLEAALARIPLAEMRLAGSRRVGAVGNGSGIAAIGLAMPGRRERAGRHRLDQFA
jgi:hypothetical protein